jgi:hypothetical protein
MRDTILETLRTNVQEALVGLNPEAYVTAEEQQVAALDVNTAAIGGLTDAINSLASTMGTASAAAGRGISASLGLPPIGDGASGAFAAAGSAAMAARSKLVVMPASSGGSYAALGGADYPSNYSMGGQQKVWVADDCGPGG